MGDYISEGDVETRIVLPVIKTLGYSETQIASKHRVDFNIGTKNVYGFLDYALFIIDDDEQRIYTVVIEVKKPDKNRINARNQARSYATSADINAPYYAVFDNSSFELYAHNNPKIPLAEGNVNDLYAGSTAMNQLMSYLSPFPVAELLNQTRNLKIPKSVLGQSETVLQEVRDQVQKEAAKYIGGQLIGRDVVVTEIVERVNSSSGEVIAITGPVGIGKSAIITQIYQSISKEAKAIYYFSKVDHYFNDEREFYRFLCFQLFRVIASEKISEIAQAHSLKDLFRDTIKGLCSEQNVLPRHIVVVIDGLDQIPLDLVASTAGVISNLAHTCKGFSVLVASQPQLPSSVKPTIDLIEIGLLDRANAIQLWDNARNASQPLSKSLNTEVPRLPIKMKIALQSDNDTMNALIKNTSNKLEDVYATVWNKLTAGQKLALTFVCTDPRRLTKQELAQLLKLSPDSIQFKIDFESIKRLLESPEPFITPLDATLRTFIAAQQNEESSLNIWNELLKLREKQAELGGYVHLYDYLKKVLGENGFRDWVRKKLAGGSASDYNIMNSTWEQIMLPEYGDEGQLRLSAAIGTTLPMAAHYRKVEFADWLKNNPNRIPEFVGILLDFIKPGAGSELRTAIQCFVLLGNATENILRSVRMITGDISQNPENRASCARGLVLLGTKKDRLEAINVLSELISSGNISHQVYIAGAVACDISLIDSIGNILSTGSKDDNHAGILISILSRIAENNFNDIALQNTIAEIVTNLQDKTSLDSILLDPNISGSIDNPKIIDKLLDLLNPSKNYVQSRHLVYLRITEMTLPEQLARLPKIARQLPTSIVDVFKQDIINDSENKGASKDWHHKDWATQFACFCAIEDVKDWLLNNLADSSPYVIHWACKYIGALGLTSALPILKNLLESNPHDIVIYGVIDALGAIANAECADILLTNPPEYEGDVLSDGIVALSDAVLSSKIFSRLCEIATNQNQPPNSRAICIGALEQVAYYSADVITQYRESFWAIIDNPLSQEWWKVFCLRILSALDPIDKEISKLIQLCRENRNRISWTAMRVLAVWGRLDNYPELLEILNNTVSESEESDDDSEIVVLTLYRKQPDKWGHLVASHISRQSPSALSNASLGSNTPPEVQDAIIDLFKRSSKCIIAQGYIMKLAAQVAPDQFIARLEEDQPYILIPKYGPDLVDALMSIVTTRNDLRSSACNIMTLLCADSDMATRCCAADCLGNLDSGLLVNTACDLLSKTDSLDSMIAGADCLAFVKSEIDFTRLIEKVEYAKYAEIRIYNQVIKRERYNNSLADQYVEILKSAKNMDVLHLWRYGRAIVEIGNRKHISFLSEMSTDTEYPNNVRFWFKWLVEDAQKNLEDRFGKRQKNLDKL